MQLEIDRIYGQQVASWQSAHYYPGGGLVAEAMWWVGCGGYVVGGGRNNQD